MYGSYMRTVICHSASFQIYSDQQSQMKDMIILHLKWIVTCPSTWISKPAIILWKKHETCMSRFPWLLIRNRKIWVKSSEILFYQIQRNYLFHQMQNGPYKKYGHIFKSNFIHMYVTCGLGGVIRCYQFFRRSDTDQVFIKISGNTKGDERVLPNVYVCLQNSAYVICEYP